LNPALIDIMAVAVAAAAGTRLNTVCDFCQKSAVNMQSFTQNAGDKN